MSGAPNEDRCQISAIAPRSAAKAAGLKVGDFIHAIDDQPIANQKRLVEVIGTCKAGDLVRVNFDRNGEKREVEATLRRRRDR
jgi:serine protease Do